MAELKPCQFYWESVTHAWKRRQRNGIPHLPQDKTPQMVWCEVIGNIRDNPELLKE